MKKALIFIILAIAFVFAANTDYEAVTIGAPNYQASLEYRAAGDRGLSDTIGINTGNSITVYADTAGSTTKGWPVENFEGDTIYLRVWGYNDGDDCALSIDAIVTPVIDGALGLNYVVQTDTVTFTAATTQMQEVKLAKNKYDGFGIYFKLSAYGTTDSVTVQGIRGQ